MFLSDFLTYTFWRRTNYPEDTIPIDELVPLSEPKTAEPSRPRSLLGLEAQTRTYVIILINRVLALVCLLSLVAILAYPLITTAKIPDIVPNMFSATLGYFGSTLLTYMERGEKQR